MHVADLRAAFGRTVGRARALVLRILDTVPPVRRSVDELVRVEIVDRAMVIGAQALLALVPMIIVLAAFLPEDVIALGVERFESVLGISGAGHAAVQEGVATVEGSGGTGVDAETVRTTTGVIGILITLFSASSFARAIQRMYEKVWQQPHRGGVVSRRRCLAWLFGWLVFSQSISAAGWLENKIDRPLLEPFWFVVAATLSTLIWWWSMRVLLFSRVSWQALAFPAMVTGVALTMYTGGSTLVMPTYVASSASQFGTLGLILAVATWLVGYAGVMVVTATVGRVVAEDEFLHTALDRVVARRWKERRASQTR
ncbi:MAG: YhjD/YihY/BrkB family envelope integrity protein [Marmoricola sp.]